MTKLLINSKKSDTVKLSKIILFCSDDNEETRHVVATLKKEELKINFFHYFENKEYLQKYFKLVLLIPITQIYLIFLRFNCIFYI